jgi:uncharacterized protein
MLRAFRLLAPGLLLIGSAAPALAAEELGVITGSERGTYYQFGLNMRELARNHGIHVNVYPSHGSVENIYAVYQRPTSQMGIVQADVLAFVGRLQSNPVLKRIAKKTRMVFPLYNEEVHILARRDIADFDDLADKRVAVGRDASGTYLTSRLLFKVSEVVPAEMVPIDTDEALRELRAGRIDAMVYVAGYPVKLFTEQVTEADGLSLLSIRNKSITEFYPAVDIPPGTYRWQSAAVSTVAVKSVLVSYDFRRTHCESVGRFAKLVATNMNWLRLHGHPKWRSVDLDHPVKGWEQYDCVAKSLGKSTAPRSRNTASANPVLDAIKDVLGD